MTATINVNLKPCDCWPNGVPTRGRHFPICLASPVPLPCPIRRTVEMTVRLGECEVSGDLGCMRHGPSCPARPIRVTCSIGGETWEGSDVLRNGFDVPGPQSSETMEYAYRVCRARWEIVRVLVTGGSAWDYTMSSAKAVPLTTITAMLAQRDAVFAALADLVRLDTQRDAALARAAMALGGGVFVHSCPRAEEVLGQYVSHLIAKVSEL